MSPNDFTVGEPVELHAFGHWYVGRVVKVGPKRVTVNYTTGTGANRDKAINPADAEPLIRKLDEAHREAAEEELTTGLITAFLDDFEAGR